MAQSSRDQDRYDELLTSILVNEKSIVGFIGTIFHFLARRTDFYYVSQNPTENMGFPPGVAEQLVVKILRACDPKNWKPPNGANKPHDITNEIMCSTVVQEVEVTTIEDEEAAPETIQVEPSDSDPIQNEHNLNIQDHQYSKPSPSTSAGSVKEPVTAAPGSCSQVEEPAYPEVKPPMLPTQKNSETYNGADCDKYCWAQTISDIDVTARLPPAVKAAAGLKVVINPEHISVRLWSGEVIIEDSLQYKIKPSDCFWSISEQKLLIHLEKVQERWWNKLLNSEDPIDLSRIDCSRPLYDLPDDHIAKIHEIQFNQQQKMLGLPTSDQLRNIEIMKKAWDAEDSPFKGQPFDPNMFQ